MRRLAWCSTGNGELHIWRRARPRQRSEARPGLEVFVPLRDTTEKTNYMALVGGVAQILASIVAVVIVVTR